MHQVIKDSLKKLNEEVQAGKLTNDQVIKRLDEIKITAKTIERVNPSPPSCPGCGEPMYRHHLC
jgi:hypothetical protein